MPKRIIQRRRGREQGVQFAGDLGPRAFHMRGGLEDLRQRVDQAIQPVEAALARRCGRDREVVVCARACQIPFLATGEAEHGERFGCPGSKPVRELEALPCPRGRICA